MDTVVSSGPVTVGNSMNTGTLILTNSPNTYLGGTTINFATLQVTAETALGDPSGGVTLSNGGVLDFNLASSPATGTIESRAFTLTSGGGALQGNQFILLSGGIGGTGNLTLSTSGGGAFFAEIANTYVGSTEVQAGYYELEAPSGYAIPGNLTVDAPAQVTINMSEQIAPTAVVTVNGQLAFFNDEDYTPQASQQTIAALYGSGTIFNESSATAELIVGSGNFSGTINDYIASEIPPGDTTPDVGAVSLLKQGPGTLILSGINTYSGDTKIEGGTLVVNGSLQSADVIVNAMGTLGGIGALFGNVSNAGVVTPGDAPGTLHIGGNYTQSSGGTLRIELGGLAPGQSDLLAVGGTATLGGQLQLVRLNNFELPPGDKIAFLTAGGGVSGRFSSVENPSPTGTIVGTEVVYGPNSVSLEATQGLFADLSGLTFNQHAVARDLDKVAFDPRETKLISFLDNEPLRNLPGDFDRIAPDELTSIYRIGFSLAEVQMANLERRAEALRAGVNGFSAAGFTLAGSALNAGGESSDGGEAKSGKSFLTPAPDNPWGLFLTGAGEFNHVGNHDSNSPGYDLTTGGFTVGLDCRITPNFAIGFDAGYANTGADLTHGGRITVNGGDFGVYATYFSGGFYVDAAVDGGYNHYSTRRSALQGNARGHTDGEENNDEILIGYDAKCRGLTVGPFVKFQYSDVGIGNFGEKGSLAPLTFDRQSDDSLISALGARASSEVRLDSVVITPQVSVAWQHEYGDRAYPFESRLASGGGSRFTVYGPALGADSLLLSAGFAVQWTKRISTYIEYDAELARSNYNSQNVSGGCCISF